MHSRFDTALRVAASLVGACLIASRSVAAEAPARHLAPPSQIFSILDNNWLELPELPPPTAGSDLTVLPDGMVVDDATGRPVSQRFIGGDIPSPDGVYRTIAWESVEGEGFLRLYKNGEKEPRNLMKRPRRLFVESRYWHERFMPLIWSQDSKTIYMIVSQDLAWPKRAASEDARWRHSPNTSISASKDYISHELPATMKKRCEQEYPGAYGEAERSLILALDVETGRLGLLAKGNDMTSLTLAPDGTKLAVLQYKQENPATFKGHWAQRPDLPDSDKSSAWDEQSRCDVYVINTARAADLPEIDLEKFDDPRAGCFDAGGKQLKPVLSDILLANTEVTWSPDSTRFAYHTEGRRSTGDIFVYDCTNGQLRNFTAKTDVGPWTKSDRFRSKIVGRYTSPKFVTHPLWLPDGSGLVALARGEVWFVPADPAKPVRMLTRDVPMETWKIVPVMRFTHRNGVYGRAAVDAQGRLVVVAKDEKTRLDTIWKIDPKSSKAERIADTGLWLEGFPAMDKMARRMVCSGTPEYGARVSFELNLDTGGKRVLMDTGANAKLAKLPLPETRRLKWKTPSGTATGVLHLPLGASPANKVPMVIYDRMGKYSSAGEKIDIIHIGVGQDSDDEVADIPFMNGAEVYTYGYQVLRRGIAVLYLDIPISDFGVYEHPMKQSADGIIAGLDAALATGLIDEKRVGLQGMGRGAFAVLAALVQTDRFKAAACMTDLNLENAAAEWQASTVGYIGRDVGFVVQRLEKHFWEAPERYLENSPLRYADKITTPLLYVCKSGGPFGVRADVPSALLSLDRSAVIVWNNLLSLDERAAIAPEIERRNRAWFFEHLIGDKPVSHLPDEGSVFFGAEAEEDEYAEPFDSTTPGAPASLP